MIIIHKKNMMALSMLNFIRLLLLSLPLAIASESDAEEFSLTDKTPVMQANQTPELRFHNLPSSLATMSDLFQISLDDDISLTTSDLSSDQIVYNEPQIMIENYNDQTSQEIFDKSNLGVSKADDGDLKSFQKTINQDSNNVPLELSNKKYTNEDSVMKTNHSTMQTLPKPPIYLNKDINTLLPSNKYQYYPFPLSKSTLGELQNIYTDQFVQSEPHSIPAIENMKKELPKEPQFNEVDYGFTPFNNVYVNQQTFLDQGNNIKLPEIYIDPSAYWRYPHMNISNPYQINLPEYNSIISPPLLRNYDSIHNNLFNHGNNVQYKIDTNTYWMNNNPGNNVINNMPDNPTLDQLPIDQTTNLNPTRYWFGQNSNYLPSQNIPHYQYYQYANSKISESQSLQPNIYQYYYYPDDQFTNYQPDSYKPLDSEIYTEFGNNKRQLIEPLNDLPFINQFQSENYNEGQIQLDQITNNGHNQVTNDEAIQVNHQVSSYNGPSQNQFTNNQDIQDIYEVQDGSQNEPMDTVHEANKKEPLWFEVNKYSNDVPSGFIFEKQHNGISPEVLLDYIDGDNPHNVLIDQGSKFQATYANQENNFKSQPSSVNQNYKKIFSENPINEVNNKPRTGFNEQCDEEELQQTSVDVANINYPQGTFDLVNDNKDSQAPIDRTNDINFAQEHIEEFPTVRSSKFETNKFNNKQEEAVTPSLFFMKIIHGALHQVDEAINAEVKQDFNSKTSQIYDNTNNEKLSQLTSDNSNNDVLHRSQIDQITTWKSPQIHIDQAVNGEHQSRSDQFINTEAPQILFNQDNNMDFAINNIENQEFRKSVAYIDHPLIQINLSDGILQSAGNTIEMNGPYLAVDYGSLERYSTFWNPLDMPFGFSDYYIIFDLKNSYTVKKMYIMNYGDTVHDITAFTLEVCDGSNNWRIIDSFFCQAGIGTYQEFSGFIVSGRYWKFTATKTTSGYQPWLVELGFHGLVDNMEEKQGYLDETSSEISSELEYSSDCINDSLSTRTLARQKIIGSVHVVSWVYYLVGLVVLGLAMLFMTCLILYLAKKRNGLYNITLVMGKNKEDLVTPVVNPISKDYTASAPPALPPASAPEDELDNPDKNTVKSDINEVKWVFNVKNKD